MGVCGMFACVEAQDCLSKRNVGGVPAWIRDSNYSTKDPCVTCVGGK
jgi:hypothetical protein